MIVKKRDILRYFHKYNNEYFNGMLPPPEVKTISSLKIIGRFEYDYDSECPMYNQVIKITNAYDLTMKQFRDVLVHEMMHYYLAYVGIDVRCDHGEDFNRVSAIYNHRYGLNITVYADSSKLKLRKDRSKLFIRLCGLFNS